jgi:uncharacterized alpha-E superfamily protein
MKYSNGNHLLLLQAIGNCISHLIESRKNKVIYFLAFEERNPNSIYNCILNARENARAVRTEITKEVWEQINALYF